MRFFFFQAEDGIRDYKVTGVQTCALPIFHMGRTDHLRSIDPFLTRENGQTDGAVCGHVAGTYFHGLFENADFTAKFLTVIAESRQLDWRPSVIRYSRDDEYNRLAATVREHLDMERVYEVMKL